jgi:hypothetical protein
MRTTLKAIGTAAATLAGLAGTAVLSGPALAHPTDAAETHTERGIVLECTGEAAGISAYVNLYENDVFTNYVQVVLDDNPKLAASREPKDVWSDGRVRSWVTIDGKRARITGTAVKVGKRRHVHEELEDAGHSIVSDGWHRRLKNDLTLTYAGTSVDLTCDPAFYYRLEVTKTPIV